MAQVMGANNWRNTPMKRLTARWTTTLAAAALFALPASGLAQTEPPSQPPATAQAPTQTEQPGVNQEAAKQHLTAARNALSQITQLPAAAQLTGDARTQMSQLISNFNELITTQSNWKAAYAKVKGNLTTLLAAPAAEDPARPSGTPGAVGTTGAAISLDPAIRAKLMEFRGHLEQFEAVAGGAQPEAAGATPAMTPPPATATTSTTASTTTTTAAQPPATPAPSAPPSDQPVTVNPQEVLRHVEAIEVILSAQAAAQAAAQTAAGGAVGTSGTPSGSTKTTVTGRDIMLNQAQLEQLRTHLSEIRRLIEKK